MCTELSFNMAIPGLPNLSACQTRSSKSPNRRARELPSRRSTQRRASGRQCAIQLLDLCDSAAMATWCHRPPDWARFCQLFLNKGELDGTRLVSRKTIELMTTDQLPPGAAFDPDNAAAWGPALPSPVFGQGFGLGMAVRIMLVGRPGMDRWMTSAGSAPRGPISGSITAKISSRSY